MRQVPKSWLIGSSAVAILAVLLVLLQADSTPPVPFPADAEVVSVTASLSKECWAEKAIPEFMIPPDHVPRLLSLFRPARRQSYPAAWDEPPTATLKIKARSGKEILLCFGFSGKNSLCYNFVGIRCVRGGPREPVSITSGGEEGGTFVAECVLVEAVIAEIHREMTTGKRSPDLEKHYEDLERSAGKRPPLRF